MGDVHLTDARGVFLGITYEVPHDLWGRFKQAWGPLNVHGLPRMGGEEIASAVVSARDPRGSAT